MGDEPQTSKTGLRYILRPQTQRILRAGPTRSKSLSLVTRVAFLAWARAAAIGIGGGQVMDVAGALLSLREAARQGGPWWSIIDEREIGQDFVAAVESDVRWR
jgi:hypothetical protein